MLSYWFNHLMTIWQQENFLKITYDKICCRRYTWWTLFDDDSNTTCFQWITFNSYSVSCTYISTLQLCDRWKICINLYIPRKLCCKQLEMSCACSRTRVFRYFLQQIKNIFGSLIRKLQNGNEALLSFVKFQADIFLKTKFPPKISFTFKLLILSWHHQ